MNQHTTWESSVINLTIALAGFYQKEQSLSACRADVIDSQDLSTEVDLVFALHNTIKNSSIEARRSMFKSLTLELFKFPSSILREDDSPQTLETYLRERGIKISKLFLDILSLDSYSDDGVSFPSSLLFPSGYWEVSYVVQDKHYGVSTDYHYELELSEYDDFSALIFSTIDTSVSPSNWYYQKHSDEYIAFPSDGVRYYGGKKIRYKSIPSTYLTTGQTYYYRIRQKDDLGVYSWFESSFIVRN